MLEIFTIGGGQPIVNVLNAVAAWCGGGGFRSLIQVVMVMGLGYVLLIVAFTLNWKVWFNWFLSATVIYMCMIVPTTSVKVTDRINPGLAPATVDNVPIGLAAIASLSSQIGDWLTRRAETVFVMPDQLRLSTNGMLYGARLYDRTRGFEFHDPRVRANVESYFRQCLFYDILLGFRTTDQIANSTNILADMGPGSPARAMKWLKAPNEGGGSDIRTCAAAYTALRNVDIPAATDNELTRFAPTAFPNLASAAAKAKLIADLPIVAQAFNGATQSASTIFQQRSLVDAFLEARANFDAADGDTFAMLRADAQARNTYTSIAQQAMTWVPLLGIVLTVVFYAMFPVIFPLFLMPQTGPVALRGYITGFFYLAAWGPLYVVLHMFVMDRTIAAMNAASPGGMTMAGLAGIDAVSADTATIAGFLMMSVPFLAAGMARGAMAVASNATSMLAPTQNAAEQAATERTTGNYAYGNVSYQNLSANTVQRDQWNIAPNFTGGFGYTTQVNNNGTTSSRTADGTRVENVARGISAYGFKPTVSEGFVGELRKSASNYHSRADQLREAANENWRQGERLSHGTSSGTRSGAGSETSSGSQQGTSISEYDRRSRAEGSQTTSSRTISDTTSASEGSRNNYASGTATNWNLGGSLNIGGSRGGTGARIGGGPASLTGGYAISARDGVSFDKGTNRSRSDGTSESQGEHYRADHAGGRDVSNSDGTYSRSGDFSRSETFAENRSSTERYYEHAQALEHQASRMDEIGRRLEDVASFSETHGYQLSEDMSQYVASRYYELASTTYRGLGAPSLLNTTPTPSQRAARDLVVGKILEDYVLTEVEAVQSRLVNPTAAMGAVDGPTRLSMERPHGVVPGSHPISSAHSTHPNENGTARELQHGSAELDRAQHNRQSEQDQAVRGAQSLHDEHTRRTNAEWFDDRTD
ncbi:MAG: conjugal transfer protein TraG [Novosphingobium sp. 17-62-19]|uniref:conjugal transfer protein TraG N-terminal domain-containing protein n=1 Tax=Novosphingobium sp. 17-62-19 TaxID=1970406 RepID=UPI000BD082D5|nr:conjugal transfer protein TraG N-terminal domain-containing protein [Novosphingobium sp. 17-62-19]OYX95081.1 MAG: conjugal transfer protein TraG [Novosphingobium sp. 35-62-5]OZA19942.1 MAG: conjugal transfer protein TraG [Novosphingobium sp. 17-62-19]HQS96178.1 conjugal transfer protein TraG N-terminal domain-containing protein [Novosphingobium sp.]